MKCVQKLHRMSGVWVQRYGVRPETCGRRCPRGPAASLRLSRVNRNPLFIQKESVGLQKYWNFWVSFWRRLLTRVPYCYENPRYHNATIRNMQNTRWKAIKGNDLKVRASTVEYAFSSCESLSRSALGVYYCWRSPIVMKSIRNSSHRPHIGCTASSVSGTPLIFV